MTDEILKICGLTKIYEKRGLFGGGTTVTACDNVSFTVKRGEVFIIAGESGSGKSTIGRLILGAERPDSGSIFFAGSEVRYGSRDMDKIRMQCQTIQQDPYDSINPRMSVGDIIAEPLEIHRFGNAQERHNRILEVLSDVKLEPAEDIISRYPHMLSGGQRQRVVLARALALKPRMIIADEPVSMLDVSIRAEILEIMQDLRERHGITFLYITHDLATARFFGTRIAIVYMGSIVESGPMEAVLFDPRHPYTQALLDAISEPDPANRFRKKRIGIVDSPGIGGGGCRFRPRCPRAVEKCKDEPALEERGGREVACFVAD